MPAQVAPKQNPAGVDEAQRELRNKLSKLESNLLKTHKSYYKKQRNNALSNNWLYLVDMTEMVAKILTITAQSETEEIEIKKVYSFLNNQVSFQKKNNKVKLFWSLKIYKAYLINMPVLGNYTSKTELDNHINKIEFFANCAFSLLQADKQESAQKTLTELLKKIFPEKGKIHNEFPQLTPTHNPENRVQDLAKNESFMQILSKSPGQQSLNQQNALNYLKLKIWAMVHKLEILENKKKQETLNITPRTQENGTPLKNLLSESKNPAQSNQTSARTLQKEIKKITVNLETYCRRAIRFFKETQEILSAYEQLGLDIEFIKNNLKMTPPIGEGLYKSISDKSMKKHKELEEEAKNSTSEKRKQAKEEAKQLRDTYSIFDGWYRDPENKSRPAPANQQEVCRIKNLVSAYIAINGLETNGKEKITHRACKIQVIPETDTPGTSTPKEYDTDVATLLAIMVLNKDFDRELNGQEKANQLPASL